MECIEIEKYDSSKKMIKDLDEKIKTDKISYIIIEKTKDIYKLEKYIKEIKKHFDIFIMYKTDIPKNYFEIENYFIIGFHALIFYGKNNYDLNDIKILDYSKELFKIGKVFVEYTGYKKSELDFLIELNIIPLLNRCDEKISDYILKKSKKQKNLNNYLKYIEIFNSENCVVSFSDKIKRKMELELINFRQKIMVKNISESFDSSSL